MVRSSTPRSAGLIITLAATLLVIGVFGVVNGQSVVRNLPSQRNTPAVWTIQGPVTTVEADGVWRISLPDDVISGYVLTSGEPSHPSWDSIAGLSMAVVAFGLLAAIAVTARRRGLYAPVTLRRLRAAGLLSVAGGLGSIVVAAIQTSPQWTSLSPFLIWVLLGIALLAVREVLARAGALCNELNGVI